MSEYENVLKEKIKKYYTAGYKTLDEIITFTEGADLILVDDLLKDITIEQKANKEIRYISKHQARNKTASLPLLLPVPNPLTSQWWFTLDSIEKLSKKIVDIDNKKEVAFLGAPTIGYYFSLCENDNIAILDVDKDVLNALDVTSNVNKVIYNVYDELEKSLIGKYSSVVIDPPWYLEDTKMFIKRGIELINNEGFIFCLLPPRLTRPKIIEERNELIGKIIESHGKVISLESDFVKYIVPTFEQFAYKGLNIEQLGPWRSGDLLVLQIDREINFNMQNKFEPTKIKSFARDPKVVRYFLNEKVYYTDQNKWFIVIDEFENNLSTRKFNSAEFSIWSTNKKAVKAKNINLALKIFEMWEKGFEIKYVKENLEFDNFSREELKKCIDDIDGIFNLWKESFSSARLKPERIQEIQSQSQTNYSIQKANRLNKDNYSSDGFRLEFQRDRDRVLWSTSFKSLANKCQVFPVNDDDSLRRRLTHSIEVMQLASTIAVSFGLNKELTEAGALVHDIGHTPFGHAGEFALNSVLMEIAPKLGGFNHYEHGVDVAVYLENAYKSESLGGLLGLNLTEETIECIMKHTFYRNGSNIGQTELINKTKHKFIKDYPCHLEGQSIRIADKISYMISDIEDGIMMGAIGIDNIKSCSFFHRAPIDMNPISSETLYERFVSQRRSILKVIMEDVLNATDRKLAKLNTLDDIRENKDYLIDYSPELKKELNEIWNKLQSNILHKYPKVIEANLKASKIIYQLFYLYTLAPELIDKQFMKNHLSLRNSHYLDFYTEKQDSKNVGISKDIVSALLLDKIIGKEMTAQSANWEIPIYKIILAKDYIASMTDNKALKEYRRHISLILD